MSARSKLAALLGAGLLAFTVVGAVAAAGEPTKGSSRSTVAAVASAGAGAQETDQPPTDTTEPSTGSSGPGDNAWLLIVGLGVLIASIVVLRPGRDKDRD